MLAELQRGLPPLQLNEEAAMRELCEFLKKNPRLLQAVMLELSPAPGSPMDQFCLKNGLRTSMDVIRQEFKANLKQHRKGKNKNDNDFYKRFKYQKKDTASGASFDQSPGGGDDGACGESGAFVDDSFDHATTSLVHQIVPESPEIQKMRREQMPVDERNFSPDASTTVKRRHLSSAPAHAPAAGWFSPVVLASRSVSFLHTALPSVLRP